MSRFKGFPQGRTRLTPIPEAFFRQLLPQIDRLDELKVLLQAFWLLDHLEGQFRYLLRSDFSGDPTFMSSLAKDVKDSLAGNAGAALDEALERLVERGALLRAAVSLEGQDESLFFLNSPRGRAAAEAITRGEWQPSGELRRPLEVREGAPNIYRLYEENIGPLSPMIAEALKDAEATYPAAWIEDAVRIAVENNARSWRYVETILKRWQTKGRDDRKDRPDTEEARRRYIEGEYADYVEH
jgi:DnaD/phage-associated family protein